MQNMMPKHQYSMLENIIFLLTLSYKEQKRLNRGMARVLLVFIKACHGSMVTPACRRCLATKNATRCCQVQ